MTREEANKYITIAIERVWSDKVCSEITQALEPESCEDAISRADIKKYLSAPDANGDRVIYESDLDLLPPVTPQHKMGRWILSGGYWRCSECKEKALLKLDKSKGNCREYMPAKSNNCPNCGVKMLPTSSDCNSCKYQNEVDGSNCYECVKGIRNNYTADSESEG